MGLKNTHCNIFTRWTCLFLILILSSCGQPKSDPQLSALGATPFPSTGIPVKWGPSSLSSPLDIGIAQTFLDDFSPAQNDGSGHNLFEQMMKEWDGAISGTQFLKVPATTLSNNSYTSLNQYRDSEMGIYKSPTWFDNVPSSALAVTQFFGVRVNVGQPDEYIQLTHADIIVNYRDHSFTLDPNDFTRYDLVSVILHELGHFLGLPHESSSASAVMQPYISTFESNRFIFSADANALIDLYETSGSSPIMGFSSQSALPTGSSERSAPSEGEEVQGFFELKASGECRHYINGKFVGKH